MKHIVLLVNLGSPDELNVASIRRFLFRFLSDKRVVELSRLIWYPILLGIILPYRAKMLLPKYKKVWYNNSSPLLYNTQQLQQNVNAMFLQNKLDNVIVEYALCYSSPYIDKTLDMLHNTYDISRLTVVPLYPQFSSTTTAPVFDRIARFYAKSKYLPEIKFISSFYNNTHYIDAIVSQLIEHFALYGQPQKLIFSYHSLPQKVVASGDRYYDQCLQTSNLIINKLAIAPQDCLITFQSKFGYQKWLVPSTIDTITSLAHAGIKKISIVCPGFISDCLETLEEVAITYRDLFISNGGLEYNYVPCLNHSGASANLVFQLLQV